MRVEAVVFRDTFLIGVDLRLFGPFKIPSRVGRERVRIERAGDIAFRAGIGVFTPGSADFIGFLDDHKILVASLFELHAHADAAKACADNQCLTIGLSHGVTIARPHAATRETASLKLNGD